MVLNSGEGINLWAILVSGLASLVIGFIWYGPLFGKAWSGYTGWTEEKVKTLPSSRLASTYVLTFAAALVTAYALAFLVRALGISRVTDGLFLGLLTGVGFAAMAFATTHLFEHKPVGLWLIVSGYQLVYQVAAAVIVTLWR
jgi:RsiW-degrading membrane proteinase PrsW (M82 family)